MYKLIPPSSVFFLFFYPVFDRDWPLFVCAGQSFTYHLTLCHYFNTFYLIFFNEINAPNSNISTAHKKRYIVFGCHVHPTFLLILDMNPTQIHVYKTRRDKLCADTCWILLFCSLTATFDP